MQTSRRIFCASNLVLAILILPGCGGGNGAPPPGVVSSPSPSVITINPTSQTNIPAAQTTWLYQQQVLSSTDTFYNQKAGTVTVTFEGMQPYRGQMYYTLQFNGLQPPIATNYFAINTDMTFDEVAGAFYNFNIIPNCSSPQQEAVLAVPTSFSALGSTSVNETSYQCGAVSSQTTAKISVTDGGTGTAYTPGGAFHVHIVNGTFISASTTVQYKNYIAGNTIVERDVQYSDTQHQQFTTAVTRYASGPLNVAFPGLSMLLAEYW